MKSHAEYNFTCNGCSSTYVGQTSRHVTTRILELQKKYSLVEQHLVECCVTAHKTEWDIIDACRRVEKLITVEAIYIRS